MNIVTGPPPPLTDSSLTRNEQAMLQCQLAKQLEELGNYERAREVLGGLWQRVGERPVPEGLDQLTTAEVLLRAGVLTGWIGSVKQIAGAQETAKNLISESMRIFEAFQDVERIAEAQTDLAYCYWREGAFDEARMMLQKVLDQLDSTTDEVRAIALIRSAIVEKSAKRYNDALRIHTGAKTLFETCNNHVLRAKFHNEFANVLSHLSATEYREDYIDRALIEYTAASFHFEQAGHTRYQASVENNLGFLFSTIGKFTEAHEHLDRAQALFTTLKDNVHLAQVDNTRAEVLLAEGRVAEAEKFVRSAVRVLERGGEQSLLAESLTTHGTALARLGRHEEARASLRRAVEVAERAGDVESAGQAALSLIEESGEHLAAEELAEVYERAAEMLSRSQNVATLKRLSTCARRVLFLAHGSPAPSEWKGFSLKDAVRRYESHLISRALSDAGGLVSRAAQLLGFKHHHSLSSLIQNHHPNLLQARAPVVPRKRSLIYLRAPRNTPHYRTEKTVRPLSILYAEDSPLIADSVKNALEAEGWRVDMCADGNSALNRIAGEVPYDLLLLDNELPGMSGLELARYARKLPSYQNVPIIMLSATDYRADARRAGIDAFLHKPEGVSLVVETTARLLADGRRSE
ncbi:MAG: two-component system, chemotaxis family, chemotaxis protein CheY [Acidobacteriota bacterium]|nr:two-component system, chemotaxis family, chemotaxis protein CheY [Acidobacteriota bacterium]